MTGPEEAMIVQPEGRGEYIPSKGEKGERESIAPVIVSGFTC
jgi:hypothetical protein